jgi:hypothetical protein
VCGRSSPRARQASGRQSSVLVSFLFAAARFVFGDEENLSNWDQLFSTDYTLDLGVRSTHGAGARVNSMTVSASRNIRRDGRGRWKEN